MKLLGPVFWYDLVRIARRQRLTLARAIYGLILLAALFLLYATAMPHAWLGNVQVKPDAAAAFANQFFGVFTVLQFAAVILLTSALTASGMAEEKGRNTLIFLLTTNLTNREIVLGKLFTRLLQVGLLVLTGLPVLGLLQFMGGVEPILVFSSYACLALTALSLGSIGLACAVVVKKPQNAAWRAFQIIVLYAALSVVSIWYWELPFHMSFKPNLPPSWFIFSASATRPPLTPDEAVIEAFNYASPHYAYVRLRQEQQIGVPLKDALPAIVRDFALTHGVIALLFASLAMWRLRSASANAHVNLTHKKSPILKPAPHPPIGDRPMLWKEVYCETKPRQRWLALFFSRWFFFVSFLPAWILFVTQLDHNLSRMTEYTLVALRFAGTLVAIGLCMRVAVHAARSIGQERDRQTLDNLLTTELSPAEIVRDKWWGSFLSARWLFLWLLIHWGLGALVLALDPWGILLLVMECLVYGAFFASLGMFFAALFPTTKQAVTATLVVGLVGTSLLPWAGGKALEVVLPKELQSPIFFLNGARLYSAWPAQAPPPWPDDMATGMTPAWVLFESVYPNRSFLPLYYYNDELRIHQLWPWIVFGLFVYSALTPLLAGLAMWQFQRTVGRQSRPRQRRPAAVVLASQP